MHLELDERPPVKSSSEIQGLPLQIWRSAEIDEPVSTQQPPALPAVSAAAAAVMFVEGSRVHVNLLETP